jgi:4-amino-4-deoxy-L-arabinose transferase-like glycosyltransferase
MAEQSAFLPPSFLNSDRNKLGWRCYLLVTLVCLAFFLPGFSTLPPIDRDEPHFAQATKQMIETGNYLDIRFQKETRYKKPVGIYWLQAASVKLLSPGNLSAIWAYRVPSLIGATASVLLTAALGDLLFGPAAGFLAAVLLASCLLLNVEARLAKTDAFLLACIMAAQYAMAKAYTARDQADRTGWLDGLIFWTAQGIGFLIKGPIVLLVTSGTLLGLRVSGKNVGWFRSLRPALGIPYALILAAPWFVAIMMASHGDFATQSAGHDLLAKIWQGQDRGILPPGLHLLAFPVVFFPASIVALLAIPDVWAHRRDSNVRFCLSWIIPMWIVFELSLTKLPHYVLPAYPAITLLASWAAINGFPRLSIRRWFYPTACAVWLIAGLVVLAALAGLFYVTRQPPSTMALLAGIVLIAMQTGFFILHRKRSPQAPMVLIAGGLLFTLFVFGLILPSLDKLWLTREVVQVAESVKPCPVGRIVSSAYNEPSLIFMAGTETMVSNSGEEAAYLMKQDSCYLGLIDSAHENAFMDIFTHDTIKPEALTHIEGPNIGNGKRAMLTLYRLPNGGGAP